jgi:hypothetical protein
VGIPDALQRIESLLITYSSPTKFVVIVINLKILRVVALESYFGEWSA